MDDLESTMRVSDLDRSEAMRQLGEGFAQGRLTQVEFQERIDWALAAVTHADLQRLAQDLPADPLVAVRKERGEFLLEVRWWIAGAVVMNGIWFVQMLSNDDGVRYWPGLPLAIWGLILVGAMIAPGKSQTKATKRAQRGIDA